MTKIIRILRSCSMKIFSKFPTINISKLNFWLVICIAKNFIWTTLKMIFSILWFFCTLRFQIYKYCPIITNHTSMERLFIQLSDDASKHFLMLFHVDFKGPVHSNLLSSFLHPHVTHTKDVLKFSRCIFFPNNRTPKSFILLLRCIIFSTKLDLHSFWSLSGLVVIRLRSNTRVF